MIAYFFCLSAGLLYAIRIIALLLYLSLAIFYYVKRNESFLSFLCVLALLFFQPFTSVLHLEPLLWLFVFIFTIFENLLTLFREYSLDIERKFHIGRYRRHRHHHHHHHHS